jgi:hypothetical protein
MSRRAIVLVIAIAGVLLALAAELAGVADLGPDLVALAAALVVAEQFELCPRGRTPVPISFAVQLGLSKPSTPGRSTSTTDA